MAKLSNPTPADVERYRQNYIVEMDGIALYRSMAAAERDTQRAEPRKVFVDAHNRVKSIEIGDGYSHNPREAVLAL